MKAPGSYQRELTLLGGGNPWGEPRFILTWGSSPIKRVHGVDDPLAWWLDCWCFAEWKPPEEFGSPVLWPQEVGAYPIRGAYLLVQPFKFSGNAMRLDTAGLNPNVIRRLARIILDHSGDSEVTRRLKLIEIHEQEEKEKLNRIADVLQDSVEGMYEARSCQSGPGAKSVVQQRMDKIEKGMKWAELFRRQHPRRLSSQTI